MPALDMTVTEAAQQLGITRAMLSRVLNEHASITPEMALRLEAWLGVDNGGAADVWFTQQSAYDLWQARQKPLPKVQALQLAAVCNRRFTQTRPHHRERG